VVTKMGSILNSNVHPTLGRKDFIVYAAVTHKVGVRDALQYLMQACAK